MLHLPPGAAPAAESPLAFLDTIDLAGVPHFQLDAVPASPRTTHAAAHVGVRPGGITFRGHSRGVQHHPGFSGGVAHYDLRKVPAAAPRADESDEDEFYHPPAKKLTAQMEKKKNREKRRRHDINLRFAELSELLEEISDGKDPKTNNRAELIGRAIDTIRKNKRERDEMAVKEEAAKKARAATTPSQFQANPDPAHPLMFVVPTAPPAANSTCNSSQAPSCMVYSVPLSSSGSYNLPSASSLSSILQIPVTSSGLVTFGQKDQNQNGQVLKKGKALDDDLKKAFTIPARPRSTTAEAEPTIAPCA